MLEWKRLLGPPAKERKKCRGSRKWTGIFYLTESKCKA